MSEDVRRLVGDNVRRLRMAAGLSQAELAERTPSRPVKDAYGFAYHRLAPDRSSYTVEELEQRSRETIAREFPEPVR
jgi:transcriptional regulator with XRE-family HTH domain